MSRSNMLVVKLRPKMPYSFNSTNLIQLLLDNGWSISNSEGMVAYLPVGDNDSFNWQCVHMTEEELWRIIGVKTENNELIGLQLYWKSDNPGLDLLVSHSRDDGGDYFDVNIGMDLYRKDIISELSLPNYNWYARHILTHFWKKYHISQYSFQSYN